MTWQTDTWSPEDRLKTMSLVNVDVINRADSLTQSRTTCTTRDNTLLTWDLDFELEEVGWQEDPDGD